MLDRVRARHGWWKHPRYRVITVYYDGQRFYRRPFDRRLLRKVVVYERAGRYYIDEVQWRRDHRRHYGRDYDGWKDDDKRRHDDRWKDHDRWEDEDKWKDEGQRKHDDDRKDDDKRKNDKDKDESKGDNGRHRGRGHDKD